MNGQNEITKDYGCNGLTQTLAAIGAVAIAVCAFALVGLIGMNREEIVDCNKWQAEADQYPNYYITHWQKDQCDAHHITINAHVK